MRLSLSNSRSLACSTKEGFCASRLSARPDFFELYRSGRDPETLVDPGSVKGEGRQLALVVALQTPRRWRSMTKPKPAATRDIVAGSGTELGSSVNRYPRVGGPLPNRI